MRLIQVVELSLGWDDFEGVVKTPNVPSLARLVTDLIAALHVHHPSLLRAALASAKSSRLLAPQKDEGA